MEKRLEKQRSELVHEGLYPGMKGIISASMAALLLLLAHSSPASAERDEFAVGLQGGLLLPAFSPTSSTAFTLATWTLGVQATYGILDDLTLTASFSYFMFDGEASGYTINEDGLDYTGKLRLGYRF